jgi:hypothetical protein
LDNSFDIGLRRFADGRNQIEIGKWWHSTYGQKGLCRCGHSQGFHRRSVNEGRCSIGECECQSYRDDGTDRETLLRESLEACVAHEIGHRLQDLEDGQPREETPEANYDADKRAVALLNGDRMRLIRTLRFVAWTQKEKSETHPPNEERARKLERDV